MNRVSVYDTGLFPECLTENLELLLPRMFVLYLRMTDIQEIPDLAKAVAMLATEKHVSKEEFLRAAVAYFVANGCPQMTSSIADAFHAAANNVGIRDEPRAVWPNPGQGQAAADASADAEAELRARRRAALEATFGSIPPERRVDGVVYQRRLRDE